MINDFKDLEKFLKVCRKQGVTEATCGSFSFKLGDLPIETTSNASTDHNPVDPYANFPQGDLSPEQLAFYSSGGLPENDPYAKGSQ